jgi:ubiquinone/menaquinone biosynthesis C-methylase UbiE
MKLNLACGTDVREGWVNLDVVKQWPNSPRACDIIWDARKDKIPYDDGTVEQIYMGYTLLHLAPKYHDSLLRDVERVLIPGGELIVGEVDMDIVMRRYLVNPFDSNLSDLIWGEQGNWVRDGLKDIYDNTINDQASDSLAEFDKHCQGFTENSLRSILMKYNFVNLNRINIHCADVFYELTIKCNKKLD